MSTSAPRLYLISAKESCQGIAPDKSAAMDLDKYEARLKSICTNVPKSKHGIALTWVSDWRMYCFERNVKRWPDGKYYLLNRGYQFWRGHRIACTRSELTALGLDEWDRKAILCAHGEDWAPMEADCFHLAPRRKLELYVELVGRLADALAGRVT